MDIVEKKKELLTQLFEISMRINFETEMACWVAVSGHVSSIKITVGKSKEGHFHDKVTTHECYYQRGWGDQEEANKEFFEWAQDTLAALNQVLGRTFTKRFTGYCNLIDMSCSQVFVSEEEAKRWVKKMKLKYDKVHAITGYKEELV